MLINGIRTATIDALDRGLQYGDGLFETIAVCVGQPCLWRRHMERLCRGCRRLGISAPDPATLWAEAEAEIAGQTRCVLKILVTRGAGGRGYRLPAQPQPTRILIRSPWPDYPFDWQRRGVRLRVCETRLGLNPALAGLKHLNRLEQVVAKAEWEDMSIAEGLMLDQRGQVIEGTTTNLFLVTEAGLVTPDLNACGVAGVMRDLVIDLAHESGIDVRVQDLLLEDIYQAQAAFVTNSLIGYWPVSQLEGHSLDPAAVPASFTDRLLEQAFTS